MFPGDLFAPVIFFKKADAMYTLLNDDENQSRVLLGIGTLELRQGNPKNALNYFDAAIPLFQSFNFSYEEASAQLNKAEALVLLEGDVSNQVSLAKNALEIAKSILESNSYSDLRIDSFKTASLIAFKEKDYIAGERDLMRFTTQKDSVQQAYIAAISRGLDVELSLNGVNEVNITLQNDLDKSKRSINFSKLTNGLSIALIIILSLLTLSLYKNNNLRAKANELLQDKNNELMLAKEKAEKASLAKAQFLSTITHELRTPLYAVTGLTHLLMEENPKE